jgi:hypothetical protein
LFERFAAGIGVSGDVVRQLDRNLHDSRIAGYPGVFSEPGPLPLV